MARQLRYVDFQRITTLNTVQELTIPQGANYVLIEVEDQKVRYLGNKTNPTATSGGLMLPGQQYEYVGNLGNLRFIEVAVGAIINVNYYNRTEV